MHTQSWCTTHFLFKQQMQQRTNSVYSVTYRCFHTRSWRADYRLHCYEGQHGVLAWALGVPGLVLFALACPLATAWWFFVHLDVLDAPWFAATWGFLYEEYRCVSCCYHSFLIFFSKRVVAVCVCAWSCSRMQGLVCKRAAGLESAGEGGRWARPQQGPEQWCELHSCAVRLSRGWAHRWG